MDADTAAHLSWAISELHPITPRMKAAGEARDYYEGRHRIGFEDEKMRRQFGDLLRRLRSNFCPIVAQAPVDRLHVESWAAGVDKAATERIAKLWTDNRLPLRASTAHLDAGVEGEAVALVWPDGRNRARVWIHRAATMAVDYGDEFDPATPTRAAKMWRPRGMRTWRLTIYTPAALLRFVSRTEDIPDKPNGWLPYTTAAEPEAVMANPYGIVPVVRFAANVTEPSDPGTSDLRDVIPVQDALNKTVADLLVDSEAIARPQRAVIGAERELDPYTQREKPVEFGPDRLVVLRSKDSKVTQFEAADLRQFLEMADMWRLDASRIGGVPAHLMLLSAGAADQLSGEAYARLEGRLVAKVEHRQAGWGSDWSRTMALLDIIDGAPTAAITSVQVDEVASALVPTWSPAATESLEAQLSNAEAKQRLGLSKHLTLGELGYTPEQLAADADQREVEAAQAGMAMLTAYSAGAGAQLATAAAMAGAADAGTPPGPA